MIPAMTARTAFSPAPWVASIDYVFDDNGAPRPVSVSVCAPHINDAVPIATCPLDGWEPDDVAANAALMAAAPVMFAALQAALRGDNQWREKAAGALSAAARSPR